MGLRGGLRRELGDGGRGSRFAISLKSGEMFPIGPRFPRAAGWVWGALGVSKEGIKRAWGALSPKMGLWGLRAGRPPPPSSGPGGAVTQELDVPAQLQARPPPPSMPKLSPRLRRPGPSSTHWHRASGSPQGRALRVGVRGGLL